MQLSIASSAEGASPPVVLLHGLFGHGRNLGSVARAVGAAGWRTLSLDLRNHGASPHAPDMRYATLATDVLETLAAAAALPAVLIGHSLGGKVAMCAALAAPALIKGLLVADIAPRAYSPQFRAIAAALGAITPATTTRAAADRALAAIEPDAALRGFLLANARFGSGGGWRIALPEIEAALPGIEDWPEWTGAPYSGPALALTGARSRYVTAADHAAFAALFPRIMFATVPDAGHWLHADQPDAVAAAVVRFVTMVAA